MPRTTKTAVTFNVSNYLNNGVTISPSVPTVGDTVKVFYDGLLAKSGAEHVYAHVGYGSNWNNTQDYLMNKSGTGFELNVPVSKSDTFNICFKDCANNWDNNSGKNYSFDVTQ